MSEAAPLSRERTIKRYANRKLYDPADRRYVTLDDLATMLRRGEELRVLDQDSGEDLTTLVLAQVVLEGIRQKGARVPRQVLAGLVRLGLRPEEPAEGEGPPAASRLQGEAERIASGLLARGRLTIEEALALRQEIAAAMGRLVSETQASLRQRFQRWIESSEREDGVHPSLRALQQRLLELDDYLGEAAPPPARRAARRPRRATGKR
jgi:polyhydroxyalkanoate synthesis repressor PhaR